MSTMTRGWTAAILSMSVLAGCAPGLTGGDRERDPNLDRILVSDSEVPAKQGLLFMAMQDAEVARQSAGFALAADSPAQAKMQINNLLYAIDPAFPAHPLVTSSGVTPFWPGTGFGLRRSLEDIDDAMRSVSRRYDDREVVAAQAQQVTACTEETLTRVDRLTDLGQQALAAGSSDALLPLLEEIDTLARIILEAPAADSADACSLEHTKQDLETLALQIA